MNRYSWAIICLAYITGLLSTSLLGFPNPHPASLRWVILVLVLGLLTSILVIFIPKFLQRKTQWKLGLIAGMVALLGVIYFQTRIPQPDINDISQILKNNNYRSQVVTIRGEILSEGKSTATRRTQYWLKAEKVKNNNTPNPDYKLVIGKVYLTLPFSKDKDLFSCQKLEVTGLLYYPKSASNPSAFDFKTYLLREGVFAGLQGKEYKIIPQNLTTACILSKIRRRIVQTQIQGLGEEKGKLVSSIVLGKEAVNLPYQLRQEFTQAGLAHILAASGYQVSLILGTVITLTKGLSKKFQFIIGISTLLFYIGLTGFEPSVLRAGLMGIGILISLTIDKKVRPLGALLLVATILLIIQPIWIWDLGFQLSFLATFGLLTTTPVLAKCLDWLPHKIAEIIAISLAAFIWTLPLLIHIFSVFILISIPLNIISSPLVTIISLGAMISAGVALIFPPAGSLIAQLLYFPTYCLMEMAKFGAHLPSLVVGKIPLLIMLLIYSLMILVWLNQWFQHRWWLIGLLIVILAVIPVTYKRLTLIQVTVLDTKISPVIVIQNRGGITLINHGSDETIKYTLLPFLAQEAINQIDCAVNFNVPLSHYKTWDTLKKTLSIKQFFSRNKPGYNNCKNINLISLKPSVLELKINQKIWILLSKNASPEALPQQDLTLTPQVLLWYGKSINEDWLETIHPQVAIAITNRLDENLQQQLQQQQIPVYLTGRDGAIRWTPNQGFQTTVEATEDQLELK